MKKRNNRRDHEGENTREFLDHVRCMIHYWRDVPADKLGGGDPVTARLEGLAFSMLVMLDGGEADGVSDNLHEQLFQKPAGGDVSARTATT